MRKQLLLSVLTGCSTMAASQPKDSMAKDSMAKDGMMKDGVFMKDGKVLETMGGKTSPVMADVMLKNGTTIKMDGTIMMKDGTKGMLMEGDLYDLDGMKSMVQNGM